MRTHQYGQRMRAGEAAFCRWDNVAIPGGQATFTLEVLLEKDARCSFPRVNFQRLQ